jgi:hypothetical protein
MLAEMGEHQLTIRDYLRHSNLHVTNKYLQTASNTKRLAQDKLVDAILPAGSLPKPILVQKVTLSSESGARNSRLALIVRWIVGWKFAFPYHQEDKLFTRIALFSSGWISFRFARDSGTDMVAVIGLGDRASAPQPPLLAGVRINRTTSASAFPSFEC